MHEVGSKQVAEKDRRMTGSGGTDEHRAFGRELFDALPQQSGQGVDIFRDRRDAVQVTGSRIVSKQDAVVVQQLGAAQEIGGRNRQLAGESGECDYQDTRVMSSLDDELRAGQRRGAKPVLSGPQADRGAVIGNRLLVVLYHGISTGQALLVMPRDMAATAFYRRRVGAANREMRRASSVVVRRVAMA